VRVLVIGIMSGTSLDGADAVLADFSQHPPRSLATSSVPFSADLRRSLLALSALILHTARDIRHHVRDAVVIAPSALPTASAGYVSRANRAQ